MNDKPNIFLEYSVKMTNGASDGWSLAYASNGELVFALVNSLPLGIKNTSRKLNRESRTTLPKTKIWQDEIEIFQKRRATKNYSNSTSKLTTTTNKGERKFD